MAWLMGGLGIIGVIVFVAVLFAGAFMTLLGLPGTLVIFLDALIYSAVTGWRLPWWLLVTLLVISLIAETADNFISAAGVKKYGGSTAGMIWAMIGGLVGAFALGAIVGPLIPFAGPVLAPVAGGLLGGFYGGYWYERGQGRSKEEAKEAGKGALFGRVAGTLLKAVLASVMVIVVLMNAF